MRERRRSAAHIIYDMGREQQREHTRLDVFFGTVLFLCLLAITLYLERSQWEDFKQDRFQQCIERNAPLTDMDTVIVDAYCASETGVTPTGGY